MDLVLKDKIILVAASSRGLGYGIADALAKEGAKVSLASRNSVEIEAAAKRLRETYKCDARGYVLDVTDAASIDFWVSSTLKDFGHIDGLVTNAGGPPLGTFDSFDDNAWTNAFNLTLLSVVRMIRAVLPEMRKNQAGAILTVTSSTVKEPVVSLTLSSVLRSGIASLVKTLSTELADAGIRVNNIVPGRIDTERSREIDLKAVEELKESLEQYIVRQQSAIPLGRYGTIEEFGSAAAFLLSDQARYITGSTLVVDGGKTKAV